MMGPLELDKLAPFEAQHPVGQLGIGGVVAHQQQAAPVSRTAAIINASPARHCAHRGCRWARRRAATGADG